MRQSLAKALVTMCISALALAAKAQERIEPGADVLWIALANGTEAEALMASELRAIRRGYDVEPWIRTRRVLINENQLPHSHPVLTIHTRTIGNELELLAMFLHEQLHWLEQEPWLSRFLGAMEEYERLFPNVPGSEQGGASDEKSTYRHLLVCDLEYQAMTALVGEKAARATLAGHTHYEWVYDTVLNDPRIREVALEHGFDVSDGVSE